MANVAIIETKPSRINYNQRFENAFDFDQYALCSDSTKKKVLKADVDIDIDIDAYEWIILIGSEALKSYTKLTKITEYSGRCVEDKFLPAINPAMLAFKPEAKPLWEESKNNIIKFISGELKVAKVTSENAIGIDNVQDLYVFLDNALKHDNQLQDLTPKQQDYILEMDI